MIGKTVKGNGFGGVLRYVFEKPFAQYIGGNMTNSTPRALASEFRAIASHNHRVKRPVAHISLSPSPEEELSELKALDFAMAYLDKIGVADCQWVMVRHSDTQTNDDRPRPHFHIVANRVKSTDYKVVKDWRDYRRSEIAIRELEQEFGLIQVQPSWEYDRTAQSSGQFQKSKREGATDESVKVRLQQAIDAAALDSPTMPELIRKLKDKGVEAKVQFQSTGRVQGLTYEMDGLTFSGTKLGKAYTFPGLMKYRGVSYEPERDAELLKSKEQVSKVLEPSSITPNLQAYGKPKKRSKGLELD
ncbi:MAG TPA: relaxase/mobilization nuclease domain-containing protein [Leptolyngbyaceae cyanobacterium]